MSFRVGVSEPQKNNVPPSHPKQELEISLTLPDDVEVTKPAPMNLWDKVGDATEPINKKIYSVVNTLIIFVYCNKDHIKNSVREPDRFFFKVNPAPHSVHLKIIFYALKYGFIWSSSTYLRFVGRDTYVEIFHGSMLNVYLL